MTANLLSIAGTDPSGGAGIQADLKTFSALGAYGMSAITAVVAQNTCGVRSFQALDPGFVGEQIDAVLDDVKVDAIKIGMVANAAIAHAIADRLERNPGLPVVLDPVMVAKSGDLLLQDDAIDALRHRLLPLSTLITPNLPEAGVLLGCPAPSSLEQMHDILDDLQALGCRWVLLKGGHLQGPDSPDLLRGPDARETLQAPRIATQNNHGTGCTLSAAITALLPRHGMAESVQQAKHYLSQALEQSHRLQVGKGHGPVHHFHGWW